MATTGTYAFNPGLGEITLYAFMNIGIRPTSIVQEHMESARMAANMMLVQCNSDMPISLACSMLRATVRTTASSEPRP